MAQTYTLDEASQRLGLPAEEFKRRLKTEWTSIRSFRDGATLRFRAADIDELARTLGQASDPALVLGPVGGDGSSEENLIPPDLGSSEDDLFALPAGDSGKSKKRPKKSGDSDARLELDSGPKPGSDPDLSIQTDEFALDFSGPKSGGSKTGASSAKLTAPKSGTKLSKPQSSGKLSRPKGKGPDSATRIPGPPASEPPPGDSSSEFELSLDPDSDSFELQLNDSSEEVPLGGPAATGPSASGINLGRPADSGVSLEKKRPVDRDDSDDFELSLEPDSPVEPPSRSSRKLAAKKSDSDSEFELSLDDNSSIADIVMDDNADEAGEKGDIFETDFELPAVGESDSDSGSEVVAVDSSDTDLENSDFDIALDESDIQADDESGSQVVLLDDSDSAEVLVDEVEPQPVATSRGPKRKRVQLDEPEEVDEEDAGEALAGVNRRRGRDDDEVETRPARPAVWGPLPAAVLAPTLLFTFLGAIMAFDLLRGMWAYQHGRSASGGLAREIAGALDMVPQAK